MKVLVDRNVCCSYGMCVEMIDEVFSFDDDDKLLVKDEIKPEWEERVRFACEQCPAQALSVED
ncbi:MAG: ferredoxin [Gammaproteobacteria bacterium]|jgi:ferredoxin|nr:ferredoxin [Gammaproteobacteria bacterium]MBT7370111.1 ferredoxin [Gammaproteobacteria bacterium]